MKRGCELVDKCQKRRKVEEASPRLCDDDGRKRKFELARNVQAPNPRFPGEGKCSGSYESERREKKNFWWKELY
jgi:hypothetical protein